MVMRGKYVSKDSLGDKDNVRNVVDDFKTAIKSLGDSNESESVQDTNETKNGLVKSVAEPSDGKKERKQAEQNEMRRLDEKRILTNNNVETKKNNSAEQSL